MQGFTLIELLAAVAIAAIMLTLAVPNFRALILNSRRQAAVASLINSINYARLTALHDGVPVTMCPGNGSGTNCAAQKSWADGWQVSAPPTPAGTATVIAAVPGAAAASAPQVTALNGVTQLNFTPAGTVALSPAAVLNYDTFLVCDSRGRTAAMTVNVLASGFVQASPVAGKEVDGSTAIPASAGCP